MQYTINPKATWICLAASALAWAMPAQATNNLIVNGGFEDPALVTPWLTLDGSPGSTLPDWTIIAGNIDINRKAEYAAYEGNQSLDIVGTGTRVGVIAQTFNTVVGQAYDLSFAYTNNTENQGLFTASYTVTGAGRLASGTVSHAGGTRAAPNWMMATATFVANSTQTTLTFADVTGVLHQGIFLDAVSVTAAVPEPATWMSMLLGFGLMGAGMRRRQQALQRQA